MYGLKGQSPGENNALHIKEKKIMNWWKGTLWILNDTELPFVRVGGIGVFIVLGFLLIISDKRKIE